MAKIEEIWKDVIGYEGKYQVSNLGRVKSLTRKVNSKHGPASKILNGRILRIWKMANYQSVVFGDRRTQLVHRLVAEAFVQNPQNKPCVNHKNGIKHDNFADNLEWVTPKENNDHARSNGLWDCFGSNHCNALPKDIVEKIRELISCGFYNKQIAEFFNISPSTVSHIKTKRSHVK